MDLEQYFRNCDFWMQALSKNGADPRNDIEFLSRQLAVRPLTDSNRWELWTIASELSRYAFQAVACVSGRFIVIETLGADVINNEEMEKHHVKYLLNNCYIVDRETLKPVVIGHVHSADAHDSADDVEIKHAEDYMKMKLEKWVEESLFKVLYGAIIIGGDIAFYQMDKDSMTFSRINNGEAVKVASTPTPFQWMFLDREDGLPELLGIFMKAWRDFDEEGMRKRVQHFEKLRSRQRNISGESSSSKASTDIVPGSSSSSSTSSTVSDVGSRETSPDKENAGCYSETAKIETPIYVY